MRQSQHTRRRRGAPAEPGEVRPLPRRAPHAVQPGGKLETAAEVLGFRPASPPAHPSSSLNPALSGSRALKVPRPACGGQPRAAAAAAAGRGEPGAGAGAGEGGRAGPLRKRRSQLSIFFTCFWASRNTRRYTKAMMHRGT